MNKPTFRQTSVAQLVAAMNPSSRMESTYSFSNGRSFTRLAGQALDIPESVESGYVIGIEEIPVYPEPQIFSGSYTDLDSYTYKESYY